MVQAQPVRVQGHDGRWSFRGAKLGSFARSSGLRAKRRGRWQKAVERAKEWA